ncbi:flagellar export chaperone FlgN [Arenibaculum pallidiluteum]|uniref:flagellar export chaperone FlgN n=1 Tax=Arenibaculum pallidiluteum TaxID=2812559 RepID=UPI001A969F34|nr:flagellar export chaperone FlgN [Arenibaculum pallidiluteum]
MNATFDMDRAVTVAQETMEQLAEVMHAETLALHERRLEAVGQIIGRKEQLTRDLEVLLSGIRRDKARFAEYAARNSAQKELLRQRWDALSQVAQENAEAVRRGRETTQVAVDVIVEAARKAQQQMQGGYGKGYGRGGARPVATAPTGFSVALDRSL